MAIASPATKGKINSVPARRTISSCRCSGSLRMNAQHIISHLAWTQVLRGRGDILYAILHRKTHVASLATVDTTGLDSRVLHAGADVWHQLNAPPRLPTGLQNTGQRRAVGKAGAAGSRRLSPPHHLEQGAPHQRRDGVQHAGVAGRYELADGFSCRERAAHALQRRAAIAARAAQRPERRQVGHVALCRNLPNQLSAHALISSP